MTLILKATPIKQPNPDGNLDNFTRMCLATANPVVKYDPTFKGPTPFERTVLKHEGDYPMAHEVHAQLAVEGKIDHAGRPLGGWTPEKEMMSRAA